MDIDRHANSKARQDQRRAEAIERQEACAKLSIAQRLERLDTLFGEGKGATRERLRLHERAKRGPGRVVEVALHGADIVAAPAEPKRSKKQKRRSRDEKRGADRE